MRFTRRELEALGTACGFALAGEVDEIFADDDPTLVAALERAHDKISERLRQLQPQVAKLDNASGS
jgi:hypothetical protein